MEIHLAAQASDWRGQNVPCHFKATADSVPLNAPDEGWVGSTFPVYTIPPNTTHVEVTAKPIAPTFWETTVSFLVSSDGSGSIAPTPESKALVQLMSVPTGMTTRGTGAIIRVSRFKDFTPDVVKLLHEAPPTMRGGNPMDEVAAHKAMYGTTWPPSDWRLPAVPDAHFLDVEKAKSGVLSFAKAPLAVNVDSVVLSLALDGPPQLFAVTWPNSPSLARKKDAPPTPFLLYIRQTNSNYAGGGFFEDAGLHPYPNNFDYADIGLFETLHYGANAWRVPSAKAADPLSNPYSKGVPYQVAKAAVDVVTVCPCPRYYGDDWKREYGVLNQTKETGGILGELQAFMFTEAGIQVPPKSVGKTAIAAFSSGNDVLLMWLKDPANATEDFLSNTVRALYFLDPRSDIIDQCITWAQAWAGDADRDKRIRLYNRLRWPSHKKLLGFTPPPEPFIRNSTDNKRTLSVVTGDSWKRIVAKAGIATTPSLIPYDWSFNEPHHLIAATMLTHALAQGDFRPP